VLGILRDEIRLLTFRSMGPGVRTRYGVYLAFGLIMTWIAGIGRYWDNERAALWQQLGVGSLAYVFILSLVLWIIVAPLRPANWSYRNVLLFVTLTSPPAILYAIPVERFMTPDNARISNMWFLAIVAIWRVALYWRFLNGAAKLPPAAATVATLLPLALIVVTLSAFNLEHAVFSIMAGIDESQRTSADAAYAVVWTLSVFSVIGAPLIGLVYLVLIYMRHSIIEPATKLQSGETAIARRDQGR
jgi:hypothetical protein